MYPKIFGIQKEPSKTSFSRIIWTKELDERLLLTTEKYKRKKWKKIAAELRDYFDLPALSAKKCRERWFNCIDPQLNKTALTLSEELMLLVYHFEHHNKWTLISQHLAHRNSSKIKNNFSSLIRKIARRICLRDKETFVSAFIYIQSLYAVSTILRLTNLKRSKEDVSNVAPMYLYEYVKTKKITKEQCLHYIKEITETFVERNKERVKIRYLVGLEEDNIVSSLLPKMLNLIKLKNIFSAPNIDEALMDIIEDFSCEHECTTFLPQQNTQSCDHNFYDPPPIPELLHSFYDPLQVPAIGEKLDLLVPSFASPAFQVSLESLQSQNLCSSPFPNPLPPLSQPTGANKKESEQYKIWPEMDELKRWTDSNDFSKCTKRYLFD